KSRTTFGDVPVVVNKVMKTRLRQCAPEPIAVVIISTLKRHGKIKVTIRYLTSAGGNNSPASFTVRHTNTTFVRMGRKILNYIRTTLKQFVHRLNRCDFLIIAIRA